MKYPVGSQRLGGYDPRCPRLGPRETFRPGRAFRMPPEIWFMIKDFLVAQPMPWTLELQVWEGNTFWEVAQGSQRVNFGKVLEAFFTLRWEGLWHIHNTKAPGFVTQERQIELGLARMGAIVLPPCPKGQPAKLSPNARGKQRRGLGKVRWERLTPLPRWWSRLLAELE